MRLTEKVLLSLTLLILLAGAVFYAFNMDVYREVDNMHPARGYAEFVGKLSDEEFVLSNCESWSDSNSWVLRSLHHFLTTKGAELDTFALLFTQAVITFAFYYSFACTPFVILCFVRVYQRRKEGYRVEHNQQI